MAPVPWNISTHLVLIQNCTKIWHKLCKNIYIQIFTSFLAYNTQSDTPTTKRLTFRLSESKIYINKNLLKPSKYA